MLEATTIEASGFSSIQCTPRCIASIRSSVHLVPCRKTWLIAHKCQHALNSSGSRKNTLDHTRLIITFASSTYRKPLLSQHTTIDVRCCSLGHAVHHHMSHVCPPFPMQPRQPAQWICSRTSRCPNSANGCMCHQTRIHTRHGYVRM